MKQQINLAASSNKEVAEKAIGSLYSKAVHTKIVEDPQKPGFLKRVPTGEVSTVTIPKQVRRKMSKSSSVVVPKRTRTINHNLPFTPVMMGGAKMKPLNKRYYSAKIKDERKQHKNKHGNSSR